MDSAIFVQNIKSHCKAKGVLPTVACRESGVGTSFINNIERRGSIPSIEKVQMMATYLGTTVSDLLGERKDDLVVATYDMPPQNTIAEVFEVAEQMVPRLVWNMKDTTSDLPSISGEVGPYSLTIEAKLQHPVSDLLGEEKEPTPVTESEPLDSLEAQLMNLVRQLTPDSKKMLIAQLKVLLSAQ